VIPVNTRVSDYVCSKLHEALPAGVALEAIDAAQFPLVEPGSILEKRIHLAVVKLVCDPWSSVDAEPEDGDKFHSALELGKTDWRDLLVSAGLEHDDWPRVLEDAGYRAPSKA
jgi:hypothetical protein